jgi:hypothetical protein
LPNFREVTNKSLNVRHYASFRVDLMSDFMYFALTTYFINRKKLDQAAPDAILGKLLRRNKK